MYRRFSRFDGRAESRIHNRRCRISRIGCFKCRIERHVGFGNFSRFKRREISCTILSELWDGYLGFELFSDHGNLFTYYYYGGGLYYQDYQRVLVKTLPSIYHVTDSWENYEKMKACMDLRFQDWKKLAGIR